MTGTAAIRSISDPSGRWAYVYITGQGFPTLAAFQDFGHARWDAEQELWYGFCAAGEFPIGDTAETEAFLVENSDVATWGMFVRGGAS
jgi:hypothetical protein